MIVTIEYVPTPHLNNNNIGSEMQHMLEGSPGVKQQSLDLYHLIPEKNRRDLQG